MLRVSLQWVTDTTLWLPGTDLFLYKIIYKQYFNNGYDLISEIQVLVNHFHSYFIYFLRNFKLQKTKKTFIYEKLKYGELNYLTNWPSIKKIFYEINYIWFGFVICL